MDEFHFSGKTEFSEYKKFVTRHSLRSLSLSYVAVIIVVAVILAFINGWDSIIFGIFMGICAVLIIQFIINPRNIKKSYESSQLGKLNADYTVTAEYINVKSEIGDEKIPASMLYQVKVYDDAVYFYISNGHAYLLTAGLLQEGTWSEFLDFIKENYPVKK